MFNCETGFCRPTQFPELAEENWVRVLRNTVYEIATRKVKAPPGIYECWHLAYNNALHQDDEYTALGIICHSCHATVGICNRIWNEIEWIWHKSDD